MFDELSNQPSTKLPRRAFVSGLTSLAAASTFSLGLSEAASAQVEGGDSESTQTVSSPDGTVEVAFDVSDGVPTYALAFDGRTVVSESTLGFEFQNQPAFADGVEVTGSERATVDDRWTPVWDQYDEISERYEELRIGLRETTDPGRALTFEVRAFDDGVGFRYVFPEESGFGDFVVTAEKTQFAFADDYDSWWIQNDFNSYEYAYEQTPVSEIGDRSSFGGAHTPLTMQAGDDAYLSVHEANLVDYAAMALEPAADGDAATFESVLAPLPNGTKVTASAPHRTPWRTVQLGRRPGDLVESNLVVNLNEPFDPERFPKGTDWIEPQKFVGIWWLMITGRADWEFTGRQSGNHGAQTGRMKRYMDFASEHGIESVLVEGWNEGWSTYPGDGSAMDFDDTYPDFDIEAVTDYGASLDPPVRMTSHNETAGNVSNYESQLDDAPNPFADYEELGIRSIKTGYVADDGVTIDGTTYNHHCQPLVNHHRLVYREAAKHRQMLEVHEPIKPTGERRTYPNVMTREGVLGQEYDSFGYVSPDHHVTFPFTRMLGGPVEYTPGIFDMDSGSGGIETTRAKQLAMYPTYLSGLHMVADLPSSYLAERDAVAELGGVLQAEFGDRDGLSRAARWPNAQGGRYVEFDPNTVASGSSLSWTVEGVPEAGEYDVHLRYASDAENNAVAADTPRTATLTANGGEATQVTFQPTTYWDTWTTVAATLSLESGSNDLSLSLVDGDTGGFNLDAVSVTETGASMPEPDDDPTLGPTVPAFQFVEDVPAAGWNDTRVLAADIGEYTLTARRKDDEWFVGAMTGEDGRALDVPLDFLAPGASGDDSGGNGRQSGNNGKNRNDGNDGNAGSAPRGPKYVAEIYSDGIDAAYDDNLADVRVDRAIVGPRTTILASMVGSGGTAIRLRPAEGGEQAELPRYERPTQDVDVSLPAETFVKEQFVTATGSNDGDYVGGTTVEVVVDGDVSATANVRFPPNSTDDATTLSFDIERPGTYDVAVRTTDGDVLARRDVSVKPPTTVASFSDPGGDDAGPGAYTYPTNDAFQPGAFDLRSFEVSQTPSVYEFSFEVANLYNAFGSSRGFSPQMFVLWVRDPTVDGGATESLDDLVATTAFEKPWHYRLELSGFTKSAVEASGAPLQTADGTRAAVRENVDVENGTVTLTLDRATFGGVDAGTLEVVPMVQSEDRGTLRPVAEEAQEYVFGGAKAGAAGRTPRVMDLVTPDGVSQSDALSYSADELATVPFVSLD
ncbi:glycoside hydrolase family 97 catalytic domain-containing protein [Halogeometricum limi]|uniref:Carbohydrate binding module (Family 6) n=1 Tax=Halogeometricum limi TaxID=555875 RepID=A0A1I6I8W1_9EURY|nr:glycoside hydrolase family 97 catalytic domain-containing protein [Halogeometricum limi]SFR63175.1 Carbohydrate binding module (family 6) [Halogeometricum limi]